MAPCSDCASNARTHLAHPPPSPGASRPRGEHGPRCRACPMPLALRGGGAKRCLATDGVLEAPSQMSPEGELSPFRAPGAWGGGEDARPSKRVRASAGGGDEGAGGGAGRPGSRRRAAAQPKRFFHPQSQFLRGRGAADFDEVCAEGGEEEVYLGVKADTVRLCVREREIARERVRASD